MREWNSFFDRCFLLAVNGGSMIAPVLSSTRYSKSRMENLLRFILTSGEWDIPHELLKAIDEIIHQKSDVLVQAGDLFDTVKPETRTCTTVFEALD